MGYAKHRAGIALGLLQKGNSGGACFPQRLLAWARAGAGERGKESLHGHRYAAPGERKGVLVYREGYVGTTSGNLRSNEEGLGARERETAPHLCRTGSDGNCLVKRDAGHQSSSQNLQVGVQWNPLLVGQVVGDGRGERRASQSRSGGGGRLASGDSESVGHVRGQRR